MSLSNPKTSTANPAKIHCEWSSKNKQFSYWNSEKKERVGIKRITFMVLEQLNKIAGYSNQAESRINSNEVLNLGKEPLKCYTFKGGLKCEGLYSEIKDTVRGWGGKFAKSVYAMRILADADGKPLVYELVRIEMVGAAVSAWMDLGFNNDAQYGDFVIKCSKSEEKTGKAFNFSAPVFELVEIVKDDVLSPFAGHIKDQASNMCKTQLDPFLEAMNVERSIPVVEVDEQVQPDAPSDAVNDFRETAQAFSADDEAAEQDKPIEHDDVPF